MLALVARHSPLPLFHPPLVKARLPCAAWTTWTILQRDGPNHLALRSRPPSRGCTRSWESRPGRSARCPSGGRRCLASAGRRRRMRRTRRTTATPRGTSGRHGRPGQAARCGWRSVRGATHCCRPLTGAPCALGLSGPRSTSTRPTPARAGSKRTRACRRAAGWRRSRRPVQVRSCIAHSCAAESRHCSCKLTAALCTAQRSRSGWGTRGFTRRRPTSSCGRPQRSLSSTAGSFGRPGCCW